jgi:hypothetical protein
MGMNDHLVDMNEVYKHTKTTYKEQPAICLWHMDERFGSVTVPKKGRVRTQHRVLIDHLAKMDGPNIRCYQPRPWYTGWKTNLSLNIDDTWRSNSQFLGIKSKPSLPNYPTWVVTMGMDPKTLLRSAEHTDVSTMHKLMSLSGWTSSNSIF